MTPSDRDPDRILESGDRVDGNGVSPRRSPFGNDALAELRLLSINHHSASLDGFERAALGVDGVDALHTRMREGGLDAVVLSTCNRIELYWRSLGPRSDLGVEEAFRRATNAGRDAGVLLRVSGEPTAHHLFRVACGLDSLLLGEGEVLGQVRDALEASGSGDFVGGVFRAALRCGGLARAETTIGEGALSVVSAAAQRMLAALAGRPRAHVVVVGAGDTGSRAARFLKAEGLERLTIVNRTPERAQKLAESLGVTAASLDALPASLRDADGLVAAVRAPAFVVDATMVRGALGERPERPLVLSDVSMPRAIDPAVRSIAGVTLQDMLGIESIVCENRARREREIPRVETIIQREMKQLRSWAHQHQLRPLMADFRERAEAIRLAELRRAAGDGLDHTEALERLTRRLVDRMIAIPIAVLRASHAKAIDRCDLQCPRRDSEGRANGNG